MSRPTQFFSPLDDQLLFRAMRGTERLGRLYEFHVDLLSEDGDILFDDIVGRAAAVGVEIEGKAERYFHGYVTRFSYTGASGRYFSYRATLRPWLWFLSQTADCQVFQDMTVPAIIEMVFNEAGFSDYELRLTGNYRTWEYNVQYRETDFNFVSRLMEQEGIYYFFDHENDKHTLVLADSVGAHEPITEYEEIPYYERNTGTVIRPRDHIYRWLPTHDIQPGSYSLHAFDFKKPRTDLSAAAESLSTQTKPTSSDEIFDYSVEYQEPSEGENYVEQRIRELSSRVERVNGAGNARGICSGHLFTLSNFPREDQNDIEYLVVSVTHELHSDAYESQGFLDDNELYSCSFEAMNSGTDYRSERVSPKPLVQGPQTAIVVGPSDEEIYVDEFGRVKVQFHWDRYGEFDENSSCWIRISNDWAGKKWGHIQIPRIGQEVIVSFLEGDADQPIITGRVYNADNMPPYDLPANKTQSGIKSHSSPGAPASHFNEIRMEDKDGAEELFIQAQRNESINVKADKSESVGHDETISIGNDRTEDVGQNEILTIGADRKVKVGANQTFTVGASQGFSVKVNEIETVGGMMSLKIKGNRELSIGGLEKKKVTGASTTDIGGVHKLKVGGSQTIDVTPAADLNVNGPYSVTALAGIDMSGPPGITLTSGATQIEITPGNVTISSAGPININSAAVVSVQGAMVRLN